MYDVHMYDEKYEEALFIITINFIIIIIIYIPVLF